MTTFISSIVENKLEKYFEALRDIAFDSFKEYQSICGERGPYEAITRANMIRDHFKKRLLNSNIIDGKNNILEETNNTFFMHIEGYPITFNKLDKDKRKSKDTDDTNLNMHYSSDFEQLRFLEYAIPINQYQITKNTPLTFGYILNRIGTEIIGMYLTYQIGKTVIWYKKIETIKNIPQQVSDDMIKHKRVK